jgi:dnd system-associated protein 4
MNTDITERSDRVNIDDSVMELYKALTYNAPTTDGQFENTDKEHSPFSTYRDIFLFAACIGFQNGHRKALPAGKKTTIRKEVFGEQGLLVMKAIAIAETGDVAILASLGDVLTIAEEYAYAGIYDLKTQLLDERGRPLWNLVNLLTNE